MCGCMSAVVGIEPIRMKVFLIFAVGALLAVGAYGQSSDQAKHVFKQVDFTKRQTEVNEDVLKKAQKGEWTEDDKLKMFYAYYLYHNYIVKEIGVNTIDKREAKKFLDWIGNDKDKTKQAVNECDPGEKVNQKERLFQFSKCLQQRGMPVDVSKIP